MFYDLLVASSACVWTNDVSGWLASSVPAFRRRSTVHNFITHHRENESSFVGRNLEKQRNSRSAKKMPTAGLLISATADTDPNPPVILDRDVRQLQQQS